MTGGWIDSNAAGNEDGFWTVGVRKAGSLVFSRATQDLFVNKTGLGIKTEPISGKSLSVNGDAQIDGNCRATSYNVGATAGASGGPFTTITSITVTNGIVTAISGS
jgi:hypothetical protein